MQEDAARDEAVMAHRIRTEAMRAAAKSGSISTVEGLMARVSAQVSADAQERRDAEASKRAPARP